MIWHKADEKPKGMGDYLCYVKQGWSVPKSNDDHLNRINKSKEYYTVLYFDEYGEWCYSSDVDKLYQTVIRWLDPADISAVKVVSEFVKWCGVMQEDSHPSANEAIDLMNDWLEEYKRFNLLRERES